MELKEILTTRETDQFKSFYGFDNLTDFKEFINENQDHALYTQIDLDNDVAYVKGIVHVNRTGWYICVK